MSRWMAKSIAWVEHESGDRRKLDAYLYKNMEHLIGTLGHRFDPEHWNTDGTRADADDDDGDPDTETVAQEPADAHDDDVDDRA